MLRPYTTRPRLPLLRPRHHGPQLGTHLLNRMLRARLAQRREPAAPAAALGDPLAREAAGLDVGEDALHRRANFRRYDLGASGVRSEEHTSELQSLRHLVCRLLLEKKKLS